MNYLVCNSTNHIYEMQRNVDFELEIKWDLLLTPPFQNNSLSWFVQETLCYMSALNVQYDPGMKLTTYRSIHSTRLPLVSISHRMTFDLIPPSFVLWYNAVTARTGIMLRYTQGFAKIFVWKFVVIWILVYRLSSVSGKWYFLSKRWQFFS